MKSISFFAIGALLVTACPSWADLRISEICPEPAEEITVANYLNNQRYDTKGHKAIPDPNGKKSGWIELYNDGQGPVNLQDYKLAYKKRGKKIKLEEFASMCPRTLAAGQRTVVYISESYDNSEDHFPKDTVLPVREYENHVMVVPFKASPKKFPLVVLAKNDGTVIDRFIVPVDLPEGYSFAPGKDSSDDYVTRAILPTPTKGLANNYSGAIPYGPNAGPLYDFKHKLSDLSAKEQATPGQPYTVTMPINPLPKADGTAADKNQFKSVTLVYRRMLKRNPGNPDWETRLYWTKFTDPKKVPMKFVKNDDKKGGDLWQGVVPAADVPDAGHLLQWKFEIVDKNGTKWTSPSFHDPDLAYEWYGTISKPTTDLVSETLQTFSLFEENDAMQSNVKDLQHQIYEAKGHPYGARIGIYDHQSGVYYDNVKIDLRGFSTSVLRKKSHGLRFNKCQPLNCTNPFTGEILEDIRKTSFIAEYCDPAFVRQALAFQVFRDAGNLTPFDYPVKLMLNGDFYQLAYHSNRFTDELIEDYYGFKEKDGSVGYGYKSCGAMQFYASQSTCQSFTQKKTPDDGDETDIAELAKFCNPLHSNAKDNYDQDGPYWAARRKNALSEAVVSTFNLPAWINYIASARIIQETDDCKRNICAYYDCIHTDTWMPLAYDLNLSFGQYMADDGFKKIGPVADKDEKYPCHPFYSGFRVHGQMSNAGINTAIEAILQNETFRQLYLRRLRTLMDQILKAPGTSKDQMPVWTGTVVKMTDAVRSEIDKDREIWLYATPHNETTAINHHIYVWDGPLSLDEGIDDLWNNYIVKRRKHLFDTHSIKAHNVGYGRDFSAGIPNAQSQISQLAAKISFVDLDNPDAIVIENKNDEAVDMSGWKLGGAWTKSWQIFPAKLNDPYALPPGTVVAANDKLYIAFDRKSLIQKLIAQAGKPIDPETALKNEVIIGNVPAPDKARSLMTLSTADGTMVIGENSGEGPTAITYPENANGKAAVNEAIQDPAMKSWLETVSATPAGQNALKAFTGSAEDLRACKMVKELPVAGAKKKVSLRIEGITPNAISGTAGFTLSARLRFNGHEKTGPIDGKVVLQEFSDLTAKPSEKALTENQFPLAIPVGNAKAKFFRLVLKDK